MISPKVRYPVLAHRNGSVATAVEETCTDLIHFESDSVSSEKKHTLSGVVHLSIFRTIECGQMDFYLENALNNLNDSIMLTNFLFHRIIAERSYMK